MMIGHCGNRWGPYAAGVDSFGFVFRYVWLVTSGCVRSCQRGHARRPRGGGGHWKWWV